MGILTKGDNYVFVNNPSEHPLLFTQQAADFSTNPNAATQDGTTGNVLHFGAYAARVRLAGLVGEVRALRPTPAANKIITIDPADPAQFKLSATFTPGTVLRFFVATDLQYGSQIEFYRAMPGERSAYGRENFFSVKLRAGDTETTVLTRLAASVNDLFVTALGSYPFTVDFGTTNAGKLTIQGKKPDYQVKIWAFDTNGIDTPPTQLDAFAPVVVQESNEGQGNWETLQASYRPETSATNEPYSLQQYDRVLQGRQYTSVRFETVTERPDLVSNELADSPVNGSRNTFTVMVVDGSAGEAFLTKLLNYLQRAAAGVTKVYVKKDGTVLAVPGAAGTPGSFLADI